MKIAIVGAQGTGKSWLADALVKALAQEIPAHAIHESTSFATKGPFDLILLTGLDLNAATGDLNALGDGRATAEAQDTQLRAGLARAGAVFHVVYGTGAARLANALAAIRRINAPDLEADNVYFTRENSLFSSNSSKKWQWNCDKCSDPDCEHRLFTSLTQPSKKRPPAQD